MYYPFSALMLLARRQKRRQACNKLLNRFLFDGYSPGWSNSGQMETIIGSSDSSSSLNRGGSGGGSITSSNL